MNSLKFIFVHGLSGWGSYDRAYKRMPYWGMRGGDLIAFLREHGFQSYAASVSPTGSAWDRACELYAQIAGLRTDYGMAHSSSCRHERFGRDFTSRPLIPDWSEDSRLVLLGHSFGGTTVRLFSELLAHGDPDEQQAASGEGLSDLFKGGRENRIQSIVALASPINGTTAYDLFEDKNFDPGQVKVPFWSRGLAKMMAMGIKGTNDGRSETDHAGYDMHIDNALRLNERISTLPAVYYFSVPCSSTIKTENGTHVPDLKKTDPMFVMRSYQIGSYTGATKEGTPIDERWQENDGLVNTFSATAPLGAPQTILDRNDIRPGIWNVFPAYDGDHISLQGGFTRKTDIRGFYVDLLTMITKQING